MSVRSVVTDVTEGNSLHILAKVRLAREEGIRVESLPAVLDGIAHAKVRINGKEVDSAPLVLPMWGVDAANDVQPEGLCVRMPPVFRREDCEVTVGFDKTRLIEKNTVQTG